MRAFLPFAAAIALSACAMDLRTQGTLTPNQDGTYTWRTFADAAFPIDNQAAEVTRKSELTKVLALNGTCPEGFEIANRQATLKVDGALGDIYDVFYTIKCK